MKGALYTLIQRVKFLVTMKKSSFSFFIFLGLVFIYRVRSSDGLWP